VWPSRGSGAGRREFRRLLLSSLAASAQREVEERRRRGQKLRARKALRRLEELERQLEQLESGSPVLPAPWYARPGAKGAVSAVWLATLVALVLAVAARGTAGVLVGILDVAMLLATLVWFSVAVAGREAGKGVAAPPSNGGSLTETTDR
jgi:hypothetical protein